MAIIHTTIPCKIRSKQWPWWTTCKSQPLARAASRTFYHDPPAELSMSAATAAYLDIYIGHREEHDKEEERYKKTREVLGKNAVIYGFPDEPEQLSVEQRETLKEVDVLLRSISLDVSSWC